MVKETFKAKSLPRTRVIGTVVVSLMKYRQGLQHEVNFLRLLLLLQIQGYYAICATYRPMTETCVWPRSLPKSITYDMSVISWITVINKYVLPFHY